jgi:NAD(P)-dependent dehydrogenase (short-subunit alcohol dehydrogenase family)
VSQADQVKRLADSTLEMFGRVDCVINVAGVNRRKPALEVTDDDFDYILGTNLRGAFLLSREIGQAMVSRGCGCQINIASLNTDRPLKNVMPYAVSKAGLAHMTRSLAMEWGPSGVRVNAIAPGFILTDLTRKLWSDETMHAWGVENTPQRRLGTPEDLVGAAIFLASPAAAFITGQILYVDGGFTAGFAWPIPPSGGA